MITGLHWAAASNNPSDWVQKKDTPPPKFLEAEVPSGPARAILKALPLPEVPAACSCFPSTFSLGDPEIITNS